LRKKLNEGLRSRRKIENKVTYEDAKGQ